MRVVGRSMGDALLRDGQSIATGDLGIVVCRLVRC